MQIDLQNYIKKQRCTLLGVGPMSLNCVNAATELATQYSVPIILIASRRQVDCDEFGGGYVNNWTTEKFANYVRSKDTGNNILLARDHGGPWQNTLEIDRKLDLKDAMSSAKKSFERDLEAGFSMLHIDPSIDIFEAPTADQILDRVFELYEHCWAYASKLNQPVLFEIGTEEQNGGANTAEELTYSLEKISLFCNKNKIKLPDFVVVQSGTKVMETRNVGTFESPLRIKNELAVELQVPQMLGICNRFSIMMKAHNTDYLSDESLMWHPRLGIHAINVAPEFGVVESRALIEILQKNNLDDLINRFLDLAFSSKKWKKWMLPDTEASDFDRAVIAGHYIFGTEEFIEIKEQASLALSKANIDLDDSLKESVKKSIFRYLKNLRIVRQ